MEKFYTMQKFYTGVGSRSTPQHVLTLMGKIAHKMANLYYTLRTGDAKGADNAFYNSAMEAVIFAGDWLNLTDNVILPDPIAYTARDCTLAAMAIAERFHPAWNRCDAYARKLHGRNAFQVLGPNLNDPSIGLICWTKDGCVSHSTRCFDTGGTGTAISIAEAYGVPITNLAIPDHFDKWDKWVHV